MKRLLLPLLLLACLVLTFSPGVSEAQVLETFDIASFRSPKGWNKRVSESSALISIEDKVKGAYCLLTLFKSVPSTGSPREDFDAAWQTLVKGLVNVTGAPQMQAPMKEKGWDVQSGLAPFEKDGNKGVALLVTSSGSGRMMNLLILTNTEEYQQEIETFLESITLKKPEAKAPASAPPAKQAASPPASARGYAFTTTRFDDGWTSVVQEDWVQVTKGDTRVLLHYPNKSVDTYNSVLLDGLKNAWNLLVAPRYGIAGGEVAFRPINGFEPIEFAEAAAIEKASGKPVYVVLFKLNHSNGGGRYMEFITPDKSAFEQEFGPYHETSYGWEKMVKMAGYNKFGVAAADLKGKWTTGYAGFLQYADARTGASAGANTHSSAENFVFGPGDAYRWDIGVASGFVGSIKFQSAKSSGKFSVPGVWKVAFSDIEGKPRTYDARFSCIKGARILWLGDTAYGKAP